MIESVEELRSLRPEWLALWRGSSTATPFQSPDWIIPWWKYFGAGRLRVLVLKDDARPLAIAPLFINGNGRSSLHFIGAGNTDYLDVIVDDGVRKECAPAIFNYLCKARSWDEIDLENLRCTSPLLQPAGCGELCESVKEQDACPVLTLPRSADEFLDSLPRQLRHNLSYYRHKLSQSGEVTFEQAIEDNFAELFDALINLHLARWSMNDMTGVLFADDVKRFHRDAARDLLTHGALRLYGLCLDGSIIACLYGFHHARCTYYYLSGFDPEFAQYSPGTILVAHAIQEAIREGATAFDFLRGREDYKYRWGAVDQLIYRKQVTWTTSSH